MKRINRKVIANLPLEQRREAQELLEALERQYEANPLLRYEPHEKQKAFHGAQTFTKGFFGGNRSGKTTAGIVDDIIQAVDTKAIPDHLLEFKKFEPPFHCRIICPSNDIMESVVFQKLREWTPKDQLVGGKWDKAFSKSQRILYFKNGSFFDFLTYEQDLDKFGGAAKHRIHYDEEPPKAIRQESMMRLTDYDGADEIFTMTPLLGLSWMFDEIWEPWQKGKLEDGFIVTVDIDDNPYLPPKQKRKILAGLSSEELEARKKGRFVHFAGMIYPEFSRTTHVVPESTPPENATIWVGIDPGMRAMAAVVWCYLTQDDKLVVFDELGLQGHTVAQVANAIKLVNLKHGRIVNQGTDNEQKLPITPRAYIIDPAARNLVHQTGRSDQMEFTDHGIITVPGQNSVTAGINRVKERLQSDRLLVGANCPLLIDQFRKYRWANKTRSESDAKEAPVKTDDHLLDALRYVVMARPYRAEIDDDNERLTELERSLKEDMTGKRFTRKPMTPDRVSGIPV